ncbi:MAG: phosphatase PAP2 family protein [Clostridia bacterium]|nr:phosphatase PAP2 family protein [Clostridia bacterium]
MEFLKFLAELRNPFFDAVMGVITYLGDEIGFMLLAIIFFWCIDKRRGYYVLSVGFFGTVLNQFLKLAFRIPRPWVKDPTFEIVESAREGAGGYSFPSGHTQNVAGTFGSLIASNKKKWFHIVGIVIIALVSLSRMYLGVHTPLDVGVSLLIALVLVLVLRPLFVSEKENPKAMYILIAVMLAFAIFYLCFVSFYPFPSDVDTHNLESGTKNAYNLLGALLGFAIAYPIEKRYVNFDVKGVWWVQILKTVIGLGVVIAIKELLKIPLVPLLGTNLCALVRYFLLVFVAVVVWPMTFPFFNKLAKTK